jgi:hypothetical protein
LPSHLEAIQRGFATLQLKRTKRLDFYFVGQELSDVRLVLDEKADADTAVRAEVAGNGDELARNPFCFEELFCAEGAAYGLKEHHAV